MVNNFSSFFFFGSTTTLLNYILECYLRCNRPELNYIVKQNSHPCTPSTQLINRNSRGKGETSQKFLNNCWKTGILFLFLACDFSIFRFGKLLLTLIQPVTTIHLMRGNHLKTEIVELRFFSSGIWIWRIKTLYIGEDLLWNILCI